MSQFDKSKGFPNIYKRHTNFAYEPIEKIFHGTPDFGKKNYMNISLENRRPRPQTLFQLCSLLVTKDELESIPKCVREDCEKHRNNLYF